MRPRPRLLAARRRCRRIECPHWIEEPSSYVRNDAPAYCSEECRQLDEREMIATARATMRARIELAVRSRRRERTR